MNTKIRVFAFFFFLLSFVFFTSCEKNNFSDDTIVDSVTPIYTTESVLSITSESAKAEGRIVANPDFNVLERGFVWSESVEPMLEDNKILVEADSEFFYADILGLTSDTKYYLRAYAITDLETKYGNTITFTTIAVLADINKFVDSRDGHVYNKARIGNQTWLAENLKYLPSISEFELTSIDDPQYYVYGYMGSDLTEVKKLANYSIYGVLYNWHSAKSACPEGWRLPGDDDWKELESYLGMSSNRLNSNGFRGTNQGAKLAGNKSLWEAGAISHNESFGTAGFNAIPGGICSLVYFEDMNNLQIFDYIGKYASFATDTEIDDYYAYQRSIEYGDAGVYRTFSDKSTARSVRCIKE